MRCWSLAENLKICVYITSMDQEGVDDWDWSTLPGFWNERECELSVHNFT